MKYDEMMAQGTDFGLKACKCGKLYEVECPTCNSHLAYFVEIGVASGPDDWEFNECGCGCGPFDSEKEAISHAKYLVENKDGIVRVVTDSGLETWANA